MGRNALVLVAAAVAALALLGQASPALAQDAGGASLSVTVTVGDGAEPVGGLTVRLEEVAGHSVAENVTDGGGTAALSPDAGEYFLVVSYNGTPVPSDIMTVSPPGTISENGTLVFGIGDSLSLSISLSEGFYKDSDGNGVYDWLEEGPILETGDDDDDGDVGPPGPGPDDGGGRDYSVAIYITVAVLLCALAALGYSKIGKDRLLDHSTRQIIYDYIHSKPGVHFRRIQSDLNLPLGVLNHHLRRLEREELVKSSQVANCRRYFPIGHPMRGESLLNDAQRSVYNIISRRPGISPPEVASSLNQSRRNVYYHLEELKRFGLVRAEKSGRSQRLFAARAG